MNCRKKSFIILSIIIRFKKTLKLRKEEKKQFQRIERKEKNSIINNSSINNNTNRNENYERI